MRDGPSIAILCPGPSLSGFIAAPVTHDVYIGVNLAAQGFPCVWWVFNDWQAFAEMPPLGRPRLFTSNAVASRLQLDNPPVTTEWDWLTFEESETSCPSDPGWRYFSMTCAMVLAEHLGAGAVTIYGCDWRGPVYFDGSTPRRGTFHDYRWGNEEHKYGHVAAWLGRCGVGVTRVRANEQV